MDQVLDKLKELKFSDEHQFPIIVTDLKEGASAFNLLHEENAIVIRYIDFGYLFNQRTKEQVSLAEIL